MDVFDDSGIDRSAKKLSLRQINTSRFEEEFHVVRILGEGQFGDVYKCFNRLDGCLYAIKKSKLPVAGTSYELVYSIANLNFVNFLGMSSL